jgi:hypothetical protein
LAKSHGLTTRSLHRMIRDRIDKRRHSVATLEIPEPHPASKQVG